MQFKLSEHRGDDAYQPPQTSVSADRVMNPTLRDHSPHDLNLSVTPSGTSPRAHHKRPRLERRSVLVRLEVEPSVGSTAGRKEAQKVPHVDRQLRLDVRDSEEAHLNSLASAPQISVDRLIAAIPKKSSQDDVQPGCRVSQKKHTRPRQSSLRHHLPMVKTVPLGTNIDSIGSPLSLARRANSVV